MESEEKFSSNHDLKNEVENGPQPWLILTRGQFHKISVITELGETMAVKIYLTKGEGSVAHSG